MDAEIDITKLPASVKDLYPGCKIGFLQLLRRVRPKKNASNMTKYRWRVKCTAPDCGEEFTIPSNYLVRRPNPKTHCGCQNKSIKTIYNQEYRIWIMMRKRCIDETHVAYKHYGGRGIKVCSRWFNWDTGFAAFLEDMGERPSPGHSLDRIDVDGNYAPGNVRWATAKEQAANTRAAVAKRKMMNDVKQSRHKKQSAG